MTTQTPDAVREASPYVAGPIWAEPEDDCFTAEIQTVGGHSIIATVHGSTRDEAEQRQRAILTALDSRAGDAGEEERLRKALERARSDLHLVMLHGSVRPMWEEAKAARDRVHEVLAATPMRDCLEPTTDDVRGAIHRLTVLAQKESDPPAITKAMIWAYLHGRTDVATPAPAVDAVPAGMRIEDGKPISEAPYACHVLAGRLDHDAGEWIMAVVSSPPIYPFTHWWPLPGMTAALSHGEGRK